MLAKSSGSQPDNFVPHLESIFTDVDSQYSKHDAVLSNISWITRNISRTGRKQAFCKKKKSTSIIICIIDLFTLPEGSVLDPYAGLIPTTIVALVKKRARVCIEK